MLLSEIEQDALSELINIGFGRAANALSILVGQRVLLETPVVSILPLTEMERALNILSGREMITVHQVFNGKLSGDMVMILDMDSASVLVDLLDGGPGLVHPLTKADQETVAETGNIILNAFCGSFGNLLRVHITFAVPNLRLESIQKMMQSFSSDKKDVQYALIVRINFRLIEGELSGFVVIVMGIQSLETLLGAMRAEGYLI
jgi:chemotaxis protein CheC